MILIYFGTPDFSVPFLEALIASADFEVVAVVTQPDKPVGRAQEMMTSPIKRVALKHTIPVLQFPTLKKPEVAQMLRSYEADAFVVINYGKLIPKELLEMPPLGCVNVHPSLLPKYRGPTPYLSAILEGETQTGVSIMLLDEGMDTGPMLAQTTVPVLPTDTSPVLAERLADAGVPLLLETLRGYATGAIRPVPQDDSQATTTKLLDREDGFVSGRETPEELNRKIRAYTPWPGCYTIIKHGGKDLRVKLLPGGLVQPEGKKPMGLPEFERGYGRLFAASFKK